MTGRLLGLMALLLSRREREVLKIVEDLGDPHALQIVDHYHKRYDEPLEATNVVLALRRLVEKGRLTAQCRPAPDPAPFDERVHFMVTTEASAPSHRDPASGPSLRPSDTGDLMQLLRLALEKAGQGPATRMRDDHANRAVS